MNGITRKQVFEEEINTLYIKEHISLEEYTAVKQAYEKHMTEIQQAQLNAQTAKTVLQPKPRKVLSIQEIRERNITWVLIAGVIMVLLSGLIIATSAWDHLSSITKTIGISLVAIIFFIISWFAENKLKIKQTAFAFWILGSLFLPVTFLSIGFFQLFGEYLSLTGTGKYLLGLVTMAVCLPVYVLSAIRYKNKLFAWISLITLSLGTGFLIASFYPPIDLFYLAMIIYNSCLLFGYIKFKNSDRHKLFIQELPLFTQANLIISTLLMLAFFKSPVFYGFNIMLTSVLYILVVYSQGKKEYIYVFGGLLVYGIYQVVENSILSSFNLVIFALLGFIFLVMEQYLKSDVLIKKMFHIISGIISFCAFIYISYEGMLIRNDSPSLLLFFSYILIAFNYKYLAYKTEKYIFSTLAPVFLVIAGYQSYLLTKPLYSFFGLPIHLYMIGVIMFLGLFVFNKSKYLKPIKYSSLQIASIVMFIAIYLGFINQQYILLGLMLLTLGFCSFITYKSTDNEDLKTVSKWLMPLCWYLSLLSYFPVVFPENNILGNSIWIIMSVVILLSINEWFKRFNHCELAKCFFTIAHIALVYNLVITLANGIYQPVPYLFTMLVYLYSMYRTTNENGIRYSLYAFFSVFTITIFMAIDYLNITQVNYIQSIVLVTAFIMLLWYKSSGAWRYRIIWYLVPYSFIGVISASTMVGYFSIYNLVTALISIAIALWIVKLCERPILNIIPLSALLLVVDISAYQNAFSNLEISLIYLGVFFLVKIAGEKLQKKLYVTNAGKGLLESIDWYTATALLLILQMMMIYQEQLYLEIIPHLLLPYLLYLQINRVEGVLSKQIVKTLASISVFFPYYVVLARVPVPNLIELEFMVLPWIILVMFLSSKLWTDRQSIMKKAEYGVMLAVALILIRDALIQNNPYEGIILGVLSIASIIGGLQFKKKSFFFIGIGALAVNILITTREYWGNMPWWVYLLLAGLLLIAVASYHEINKNEGKKKWKLSKEIIINQFSEWQ